MGLKTGIAGSRGLSPILGFKSLEGVKVEALCDLNEELLKQIIKEYDIPKSYSIYEDMVESDIDAVLIATPMQCHVSESLIVLETVKHLMSEVTAGVMMDELGWLVESVGKYKKVYMFAENYCYIPENQLIKLMVTKPDMSAEEFESQIESGGILGAKVYLTYPEAYIPLPEIRIYDFITPAQLEVLNKRGWILMLHIPRDKRLKDPVNLAQMVEIDRLYPNALVIIAHAGRAYCNEDMGDAFDLLSKTKNLLFDISANCNEAVFTELIRLIGLKRILFGSELPILRMRGKSICEDGKYINIFIKGAYVDVSDDPHMREITGPESDAITFFMYAEILAFKRAAASCNLTKEDIKDVFYNNARRIINKSGGDI